jgi:hypothetical protein
MHDISAADLYGPPHPLTRSVAQWLEHRSPKPGVAGSSPATPASPGAEPFIINDLAKVWQFSPSGLAVMTFAFRSRGKAPASWPFLRQPFAPY